MLVSFVVQIIDNVTSALTKAFLLFPHPTYNLSLERGAAHATNQSHADSGDGVVGILMKEEAEEEQQQYLQHVPMWIISN